jgi:hypothetical protein
MQSIAAYYLVVANEEARKASARRPYQHVPPKKSGRSRLSSALSSLARPFRAAASPA